MRSTLVRILQVALVLAILVGGVVWRAYSSTDFAKFAAMLDAEQKESKRLGMNFFGNDLIPVLPVAPFLNVDPFKLRVDRDLLRTTWVENRSKIEEFHDNLKRLDSQGELRKANSSFKTEWDVTLYLSHLEAIRSGDLETAKKTFDIQYLCLKSLLMHPLQRRGPARYAGYVNFQGFEGAQERLTNAILAGFQTHTHDNTWLTFLEDCSKRLNIEPDYRDRLRSYHGYNYSRMEFGMSQMSTTEKLRRLGQAKMALVHRWYNESYKQLPPKDSCQPNTLADLEDSRDRLDQLEREYLHPDSELMNAGPFIEFDRVSSLINRQINHVRLHNSIRVAIRQARKDPKVEFKTLQKQFNLAVPYSR